MKMFPSIEATDQRAWSGDRCDRWVVAQSSGEVNLRMSPVWYTCCHVSRISLSLSHRIVCYILYYYYSKYII